MATERKLDLFWLLGELNKKNYELWDKLDDDQKKEISFYTLTMWLASTNDFEQLYDLGTIGASYVFELNKHPQLMLLLLTSCTTKTNKRYTWLAPKNIKSGDKNAISLIADVYRTSLKEAKDLLPLFSSKEILELAEYQGWQPDEIKQLKKSL
jgi:hypothetical protein